MLLVSVAVCGVTTPSAVIMQRSPVKIFSAKPEVMVYLFARGALPLR